jgi:hypothetical protein
LLFFPTTTSFFARESLLAEVDATLSHGFSSARGRSSSLGRMLGNVFADEDAVLRWETISINDEV